MPTNAEHKDEERIAEQMRIARSAKKAAWAAAIAAIVAAICAIISVFTATAWQAAILSVFWPK